MSAVVCSRLKVVLARVIYDSKLLFPSGISDASLVPIEVKLLFRTSQRSEGSVTDNSPNFSSFIELLFVDLRLVSSLIVFQMAFELPILFFICDW